MKKYESSKLTFSSRSEHRSWLAQQAALPPGWRSGSTSFNFIITETGKQASMDVNLLIADAATPAFAAVFSCNAFPGAPVLIGRERLKSNTLRGFVINNKIANVCAPDGILDAEAICAAVGKAIGCHGGELLPSSTGVIGWKLPRTDIIKAIPDVAASLQRDTILPVAKGIMTTDLYPKVRQATTVDGSIVGIAKGAGMIEPNLATMLAYLVTDIAINRDDLRACLSNVVNRTFNCITIDSDQSTSDTVAVASSCVAPCSDRSSFVDALEEVCSRLAEDIVRNGEGVHHVMRIAVSGAPDVNIARSIGKAIANSPLWQCAVTGNDPNVGRLACAIGKRIGTCHPGLNVSRIRMALAGITVFADGHFQIDPATETTLSAAFKDAEMYESVPPKSGIKFAPPINYPPHEKVVEIAVDLGLGSAETVILGADRTHEYITENADYRS